MDSDNKVFSEQKLMFETGLGWWVGGLLSVLETRSHIAQSGLELALSMWFGILSSCF